MVFYLYFYSTNIESAKPWCLVKQIKLEICIKIKSTNNGSILLFKSFFGYKNLFNT